MDVAEYTQRFRAAVGAETPLDKTLKMTVGDEGSIFLDGSQVSNDERPADCNLTTDPETFHKIFMGKLDPTMAFAMGKLSISGELRLALKLPALMKRARA